VKQGGAIEQSCTAGVGRRLFPYALCSCGDITMGGTIATVDSFDSRQGAYAMGDGAGAVGANGSLTNLASLASHFGTTIVAGSGFFATGPMGFGGDVKSNGAVELGGIGISLGRDLWVNADIRGMPTATLTRDLYQTRGYAGADTLNRISGTKTLLLEPDFAVAPPCPCTDSARLDIAGIVASAQTNNDNASVASSAADLSTRLSAGSVPTGFGCGRFALSGVEIARDFSSAIEGRVALFVDGDLTLRGDLGASLAPGAELDVFVTGDLRLSAPGQIGTQERPAALRLYVAGSAPLIIDGTSPWAVQLYAPRVPVVIAGTVLGSIFAASIETQLAFVMHYDRSIMDAGEECTAAPPTPSQLLRADECQACPAGLADVSGGACGACTRDADCCEPLVCESGLCQPLVVTQQ
jgi:hypothetical protein